MRQQRLVIALALICGLIVGLPHILIPHFIAPAVYDPLQFSYGEGSSITMEEVYTYVPEVKEILEGRFWVTDTQVAEYNGRPSPFAGETGLAWVMAGISTTMMDDTGMALRLRLSAATRATGATASTRTISSASSVWCGMSNDSAPP